MSVAGELSGWELVRRSPHPALRGWTSQYQGYRETGGGYVRRREPAVCYIPLILNLGPAFRVGGGYGAGEAHSSFVAGLGDTYALVESVGAACCMQANLTPLGAYRLLRTPLHHIAGRIVDFEQRYGARGTRLLERLANAPDWESRFVLLDAFLLRELDCGRAVSPEVESAWSRLTSSAGRVRVETLAREEGWSRKHLARRFQIEVGQSPKTVARILRFENAQRLARGRPRAGWSEIALDSGYADQAHLIREFRSLAGLTPPELLRRTDPDGGGVLE